MEFYKVIGKHFLYIASRFSRSASHVILLRFINNYLVLSIVFNIKNTKEKIFFKDELLRNNFFQILEYATSKLFTSFHFSVINYIIIL